MRLSKQQTAMHEQAVALLTKDKLTYDERRFVLEHWNPAAEHNLTPAGAFFTPMDMATTAAQMTGHMWPGVRVVDVCAGIGRLAAALHDFDEWDPEIGELICIEINPAFVEVGRKVLPEATWIRGDALDILPTLGRLDVAISNPPFGRVRSMKINPRYGGAQWDIIHAIVRHVRAGATLIVPDSDHSQEDRRERDPSPGYRQFTEDHPEAILSPHPVDCRAFKFAHTGQRVALVDLSYQNVENPYYQQPAASVSVPALKPQAEISNPKSHEPHHHCSATEGLPLFAGL